MCFSQWTCDRLLWMLISIVLLSQLSACNVSHDDNASTGDNLTPQSVVDVNLNGSVGDGPIVGATTEIYSNSGQMLGSVKSDITASYTLQTKARGYDYPLLLMVSGGTDLVTGAAPDFQLLSVALSPSEKVVNINPFSTLAVKIAQAMEGGVNSQNISTAEAIVSNSFAFGLDSTVMDDFINAHIDDLNVANIVKASEVMGEMVRRTRDSLSATGTAVSGDAVLTALAADLTDGVLDGAGASGTQPVISAAAKVVSSQVLVEAMSNHLKVGGIIATGVIDQAIAITHPGIDSSQLTGSVRITAVLLGQAMIALAGAEVLDSSAAVQEIVSGVGRVTPNALPDEVVTVLSADASTKLNQAITQVPYASTEEIAAINQAVSITGGGTSSGSITTDTTAQFPEIQPITVDLPACDAGNPDVRFINGIEDLAYLNDLEYRVFCIAPGDYSMAGGVVITASGDENLPRVLRLYDPETSDHEAHPAMGPENKRAILTRLVFMAASHWIVHGLTLRGMPDSPHTLLRIDANSQYNVFDRLLIENGNKSMAKIYGAGADYNTIQNSVLRNAVIQPEMDNHCISINSGDENDVIRGTRIISNEIYNCTDGLQLQPHGYHYPETVIVNNDFYLTPDFYTDCQGNLSRDGACAAAENGIDIKSGATNSSDATIITGNRFWGFRVTDPAAGGTGSSSAAISAGYGSAYLIIKENIIIDSANAVASQQANHISLIDNLFYNIHDIRPESPGGTAIIMRGSNNEVYRNTIVDADRWGVIDANTADYRCNTMINAGVYHNPVIANAIADYNFYYNTSELALPGSHDIVGQNVQDAHYTERCFWRKQWTGPEEICIQYGSNSIDSPPNTSCDPNLGSRMDVGVDDSLYSNGP